MQIDLSAQLRGRLQREADERGLSVEALLEQLLNTQHPQDASDTATVPELNPEAPGLADAPTNSASQPVDFETLKTNEEYFRAVVDMAFEGVLLVDERGTILFINRYIESLLGYQRAELIGKDIDLLVPQHLRDYHRQERMQFTQTPSERRYSDRHGMTATTKDGSIVPVEVALKPVMINGQRLVVCFLIDATERRQLDEQRLYAHTLEIELDKERQLTELRQQFMSMVTHEFRTPLSVINTAIQIIQRYNGQLPPHEIGKRLETTQQQVKRLTSLLDNVLSISRGEVTSIPFNPEALNLQAFCTRLVDEVRSVHGEEREIDLRLDQIPEEIIADNVLLRHILNNLLVNAIKYSPPNSPVMLNVRLNNNQIVFIVQDQGIGIPASDHKHIFKPFHRAKNTGEISGTGLGLAVVSQYVKAHQGEVKFTSQEGKGTTFSVAIPVDPESANKPGPAGVSASD
jgi:PAS domain S-box-containing protein